MKMMCERMIEYVCQNLYFIIPNIHHTHIEGIRTPIFILPLLFHIRIGLILLLSLVIGILMISIVCLLHTTVIHALIIHIYIIYMQERKICHKIIVQKKEEKVTCRKMIVYMRKQKAICRKIPYKGLTRMSPVAYQRL